MKNNITILLVFLLFISLVACEKPDELKDTNQSFDNHITDNEIVIDNEIVELLEKVTFSDGHELFSSRDNFNYVVVNDVLYLYEDGGALYHLNAATGYLSGLCYDPLCQHKSVTCPNVKYKINSAVSYNNRIYIAGQQLVTDNNNNLYEEEFIGYYDVINAKYVILDSWEMILGYGVTGPIQIYDNKLYYLKKESDTVNSLWKSDLNKKNTSERVSTDNKEFIKGFIINGDRIYYSYISSEAIYSVDMSFHNRKAVITEAIPVYAIMDSTLLCTNYGVYDTKNVKWDIEEYQPSDTPYEIYTIQLGDTNTKQIIATHIQGASSVKIDHGIITTTPDNPTYLGMEEKNGKKIYYVNENSGCILLGKTLSEELQTLDLSAGLGIDYSVAGVFYIDHEKCIVRFQAENKENKYEGIYLITEYSNPDRCTFYKINYET